MKRPSKKQSLIIVSVVLVAALTVFGVWRYRQDGTSAYASAISSDIRSQAEFTLYVPKQLPSGYRLKQNDGVRFVQDILFMQFTKDDQTLYISQQKKPNPEPPVQSIKGFKPLDISIGKAMTGEQDGNAATIILTDTSLITIAGDGTVSGADLNLVAKRLQKVE